ncbi:NifB/NifX family molybdenum-iron cluster-binding protein [candidate division KSB1 bacterium]
MQKNTIRIAVPLIGQKMSMHFGHSEQFAFFEVNSETNTIEKSEILIPPPHKPGAIPRWIKEQQVNKMICGGMGEKARQILERNNIQLIYSGMSDDPELIVQYYLNGTLPVTEGGCDHHGHRNCGQH